MAAIWLRHSQLQSEHCGVCGFLILPRKSRRLSRSLSRTMRLFFYDSVQIIFFMSLQEAETRVSGSLPMEKTLSCGVARKRKSRVLRQSLLMDGRLHSQFGSAGRLFFT